MKYILYCIYITKYNSPDDFERNLKIPHCIDVNRDFRWSNIRTDWQADRETNPWAADGGHTCLQAVQQVSFWGDSGLPWKYCTAHVLGTRFHYHASFALQDLSGAVITESQYNGVTCINPHRRGLNVEHVVIAVPGYNYQNHSKPQSAYASTSQTSANMCLANRINDYWPRKHWNIIHTLLQSSFR